MTTSRSSTNLLRMLLHYLLDFPAST